VPPPALAGTLAGSDTGAAVPAVIVSVACVETGELFAWTLWQMSPKV
jgi:hypothetical protein